MSALQKLVGQFVNKIDTIQDYLQIVFSDGTTLHIYNNYNYNNDSVLSTKGKQVSFIEENINNKIIIHFISRGCLTIKMSDDDYNAPEAMTLRRGGEALIVWN